MLVRGKPNPGRSFADFTFALGVGERRQRTTQADSGPMTLVTASGASPNSPGELKTERSSLQGSAECSRSDSTVPMRSMSRPRRGKPMRIGVYATLTGPGLSTVLKRSS